MPPGGPTFIFHDPSGKRWIRFRRSLQTSGLILALSLTLVVPRRSYRTPAARPSVSP